MSVGHPSSRWRAAGALLALGLLTGGCAGKANVPSEQRYATAVEAMRGSPGQRQKAVANCVASLDRQPATNRQNLASLANWPRKGAIATLKAGDLIEVELAAIDGNNATVLLEQTPIIEGALVALDNHSGEVLAMAADLLRERGGAV